MNTVLPSYDRQARIFNPGDYERVTVAIIGLGNTGSNTAVILARMGIKNFILYDFDTVEEHNLNSQCYTVKDNGHAKCEALAEQLTAINPEVALTVYNRAYEGEELPATVMVAAVDSLDIRRNLATAMAANDYNPFVIDGRMGGGQIEVYSQPASEWLSTIGQEADEDACGAKFIAYVSLIGSGFIANQVKRHLKKEKLHARILFHADTHQVITA